MSQPSAPRSLSKKILFSPDEPRLRAGWRLAIQTVMLLLLLIIPLGLTVELAHWNFPGTAGFFVNTLISFIAFTASVYLARRFLDRRSFTSLGLQIDRNFLPDLIAGIAITFIVMGLIYLTMSLLGWLHFSAFAWQVDPLPLLIGQTLVFFIVFILVGWQEELLFRGYQLQTLASGMNLFWGVLVSSIIFGLLHLSNPNAMWVSAAGIFFAGVFLTTGYLRTGRLWLSIGLHIGWNFFEGVVFGFPVSGLTIYPLLRIQVTGPSLWTGGAFGPEAGLIVLPGLAIGAILILVYTHFRGAQKPAIK